VCHQCVSHSVCHECQKCHCSIATNVLSSCVNPNSLLSLSRWVDVLSLSLVLSACQPASLKKETHTLYNNQRLCHVNYFNNTCETNIMRRLHSSTVVDIPSRLTSDKLQCAVLACLAVTAVTVVESENTKSRVKNQVCHCNCNDK